MSKLKEEMYSHLKLNDDDIVKLINSLEVKIRGIREVYEKTGAPPLWMTDFVQEAQSLMVLMSHRAQFLNLLKKAGATSKRRALPLPSKKKTMLGI